MKRIFFILTFVLLTTFAFSQGYYLWLPNTLRNETTFGLFDDSWDIIIWNPAQLGALDGMELYTNFNNSSGRDHFEIGFRKAFSESIGGFSLYITNTGYVEEHFWQDTDTWFYDDDANGISDRRRVRDRSNKDSYEWNETQVFVSWGRKMKEDLYAGLTLGLYLYNRFDRYNDDYTNNYYNVSNGQTLSNYHSWSTYEEEYMIQEMDLTAACTTTLSIGTVGAAVTYENVNREINLNDCTGRYEYWELGGHNYVGNYSDTGSAIWNYFDDSPFSGNGFGVMGEFIYDKIENHRFSIGLQFNSLSGDVEDGNYRYDENYVERTPVGTLTETYSYYYYEDVTRTGTAVEDQSLGLFLRYYHPLHKKVNLSAGIFYVPIAEYSSDYTQSYNWHNREDFNDGDDELLDPDDWHYEAWGSDVNSVQIDGELNIIALPIAFEIQQTDYLTWRFGVEHRIYNEKYSKKRELISATPTQWHDWDDGGGVSWGIDSTPQYDNVDYDEGSSNYHRTNFMLGLSYRPIPNLIIDIKAEDSATEYNRESVEIEEVIFSVKLLL